MTLIYQVSSKYGEAMGLLYVPDNARVVKFIFSVIESILHVLSSVDVTFIFLKKSHFVKFLRQA